MSTWNHRVVRLTVRYEDEHFYTYAIHEAHYEGDKPVAITEHPTAVQGDDVEGLRLTLKRMLEASKQPVLNYEEF
jgi:hypothetical protein